MHLHDALIDQQGCAYAVGEIDLPAPSGGDYPVVSAPLVRIRSEAGGLSLAAAWAFRDKDSGYLDGATHSPVIFPNRMVSDILKDALRFGAKRAPTFSIEADGSLRDPSGTKIIQYLSDWRGSAESLGEDSVRIELSAALRPSPSAYTAPTIPQLWNEGGDLSQRLRVVFSMDAATRAVSLGTYSRALPTLPVAVAAPLSRSTVDKMSLKSTPLGTNGTYYGVTEDGRSVEIYEGGSALRNTFVIHDPRPARRTSSGFLANDTVFPRIWFEGVDLDSAARSLRPGRNFTIAISGNAGTVDYTGGGSDGPGESKNLRESRCEFELTHDGLVMTYEAQPEDAEALRGRFTLPWELLILRSPLFVRHQDELRRKP